MNRCLINIFLTIFVLNSLGACGSYQANNEIGSKSQIQQTEEVKASITPSASIQQVFIQAIIRKGLGEGSVTEQVWRINLDKKLPEFLFELPNRSDEPLDQVFSPQELTAFEEWYSLEGDKYPPARDIYPLISTRSTILSPTGQQLAWIESVYWGPPESTTVFSMIRLVVSNVTGADRKILHETALHPNGWLSGEESDLGGLNWSPDGQKLIFVEGLRGNQQAKLVDVSNGTVEDIGILGEGGILSSWSPDGTSLVMNSPNTLNIFSITNAPSQKDLAGSWGNITGVDWSPDGKTILFAAAKDTYPERLALYGLNVETKALIELPLDKNLSYENPKWSPDGKLIAINVRGKWLDWVDKLFIYDIAAQKVVAMLEGRRSSPDFYWADDSQSILLTMGSPPDSPQTVQLFHWQENRTEIIPFPEGIDDGVAIGISSE